MGGLRVPLVHDGWVSAHPLLLLLVVEPLLTKEDDQQEVLSLQDPLQVGLAQLLRGAHGGLADPGLGKFECN